MKKVYFACSVRGGGDTSNYASILSAIEEVGGKVLSEIFVNDAIQFGGSPLPEADIYNRDIAMINEADVVIAEVTNPSLGVGYELGYAETLDKPILCLFDTSSERRLSAMVSGNPKNVTIFYTAPNIPATEISNFLAD